MRLEKPKKKAGLTPAKVEKLYFNPAIRRRDGRCVTCGKETDLQSSHFIAKKTAGALRFYPPNAHAQCSGCHRYKWHNGDTIDYTDFMTENVPELGWMKTARKATIHYGQGSLTIIKELCATDRLAELTAYIYELVEATK